MKVTPLDLRQQRFRVGFRGFDRTEVLAFLAAVADDYEEALRETDRLRQETAHLKSALEEHREHERNLRNTLLTAQKLADEIRAHAEQDAQRMVRDAEGRAELLLDKARARTEELQRETDTLRLKRRDVEASLEATIAALRNSLDFVRSQEQRERDETPVPPRVEPSIDILADSLEVSDIQPYRLSGGKPFEETS
jgi:cell division initiation protein